MKKALLGVVLVLVVAVVGVVAAAAATQSDTMEVERSARIDAEVEEVLPHLTDLRLWNAWSPWSGLDPNQTLEYSEPAVGPGAWYTWQGNSDVGRGKMTIRSVDATNVAYDLEFIEPFESSANVTMQVAAEGDGTQVTWRMESENNLMGKVFGLFMDMEGEIGRSFETGLQNLAREVASAPADE